MIPYMVGKLVPNPTHHTRGLVKYVPGRGYFGAVPSPSGDKFVTSRPPSTAERVASSQARGGLIKGPFGAFSAFKAATDFPAARHHAHINVEETFALHEVPKLGTTTRPGGLKAVVDANHKRCMMPLRKGVHGTRRPTTLLRNSSGCK